MPSHPCFILKTGPCVTDFTTFWIIILSAVILPLLLFFMFYVVPGPSLVRTFISARLKGSPIILKWRRDGRVDPVVGDYKVGTIIHKKHGGFIPQLGSFGYLPHGFRITNANEAYGVTLPHDVVKSMEYFKKLGFNTLKEVEEFMTNQIFLIEGKLSAPNLSEEEKKELEEKRKEWLKERERVGDLQEWERQHNEMYVHFNKIQNFFKMNINPSYIDSTIEQTVSEHLKSARKIDINKIIMVVIIFTFIAVIALAILSSLNLGGGGGINIPNPIPQASRIVTSVG